MSVFARVKNIALDVIFPPSCLGCGDDTAFLCEECLREVAPTETQRCPRCWKSINSPRCWSCAQYESAVTESRASFAFDGVIREAVHAFKYSGVSALAPAMGKPLAMALRGWDIPVDVLVPVPLWRARKRSRGYNQAGLLAEEIGRIVDIQVESGALRRTRSTTPQVQQPDAASRRRNVEVHLPSGGGLSAGSVLLIDDVATTGATLDTCARVLLNGGVDAVYGLTFARED